MTNKQNGNEGEIEVVELVGCPNCKKKLMLFPPSFPLLDVYCSTCFFVAQIKTSHSKPKKEILGAGWDVMDKNLKAGHLIPALIINFKWAGGQEIRFYPFITREDLKTRKLSNSAIRANYKMFNYIHLDTLPFKVLNYKT